MKKAIAMVLALCLCFAAVPTVFAETKEVRYSIDDGATWTEDSLMNALCNTLGKGNVKIELLRDITLDSSWYAQQDIGFNGDTVLIDGKGFTIKRGQGAKMLFCVRYGCNVTLKNITLDGGAVWDGNDPATRTNSGIKLEGNNAHLIYVDGGATLTFESGTILQNSDLGNSSYGAAVCVGYTDDGAKLIVKDGVIIRNNSAESGAAIAVVNSGSTVEMQGGEIYGNYASGGGGAVYVEPGNTFDMKGGKIYNNASGNNGGGVCVNGTFNMENGEISGNKSVAGGGGVTALTGTFNLTGGEVKNNSITGSMGGGVLVHNGSMSVSGSGTVYGNTINGTELSNIYLNSGKKINITGELTNTQKIGVTASNKGIFTEDWDTHMNGKDIKGYFSIDTPGYIVNCDENTKELIYGEGAAVTFDANGGEGNMFAQTFEKNVAGNLSAGSFSRGGYEFLGWATEPSGEVVYADGAEITLTENVTLYAVWNKIPTENNNENVEKDTVSIEIDLRNEKENEAAEEGEENPNTGAPVFVYGMR